VDFGVSYYPEITPESEWANDLRSMRDLGLRYVRVLEFAWSAFEPRESVYQFDWVDRFVDLAHGMGLKLVLCTPTATPPAWLTTQYPQVLNVRRDGSRHTHGGRRDVDLDSEIFQHYAVQIAREMGSRYGQHPAVVGWQIDNELIGPEGDPPESHSESTTFRFRQYLKSAHGDLATLNTRWGTRFWSQDYSDWGEIQTPLNPRTTLGHVLDYARYFTHSLRSFLQLQARALREVIGVDQWISHNSTAVFDRGIDHLELHADMDVAGWDAYPGAAGRPHPHAFAALAHDLFRSAKSKPFWVLETSPLRDNAPDAHFAQCAARGATAALMWHWREHRANAENESDVFADVAGRPDPQRVDRLQSLIRRLDAPPADHPRSATALLYCPDCVRVGLTPDPYMRDAMGKRVSYLQALIETYRVLWRRGVIVDVVRPGEDISAYKLLVMPSARLLSNEACEQIRSFVGQGGTLLGVAKTAHQDQWGNYCTSPCERLSDLLGFSTDRNLNLPSDTIVTADWGTESISCLPHAERVDVRDDVDVLARFRSSGLLNGAAAAFRVGYERGMTYYAAACSDGLTSRLLTLAATRAGVRVYEPLGEDVGLLATPDGKHVHIFNYAEAPIAVDGQTIASGDFARVASDRL